MQEFSLFFFTNVQNSLFSRVQDFSFFNVQDFIIFPTCKIFHFIPTCKILLFFLPTCKIFLSYMFFTTYVYIFLTFHLFHSTYIFQWQFCRGPDAIIFIRTHKAFIIVPLCYTFIATNNTQLLPSVLPSFKDVWFQYRLLRVYSFHPTMQTFTLSILPSFKGK